MNALMMPDRSKVITLQGEAYELILTTRATKEIGKRFGGLEKVGEALVKAENFEQGLDTFVWLLTLLINQSILIYNLRNREKPKPLLTEEEVELLTNPGEMSIYQSVIMQAMNFGVRREVESEETISKNAEVG